MKEFIRVKCQVTNPWLFTPLFEASIYQDDEEYSMAKLFYKIKGVRRIDYGCYNLIEIIQLVKIDHEKDSEAIDLEETKRLLLEAIQSHRTYGTQNYFVELYTHEKDDTIPLISFSRHSG